MWSELYGVLSYLYEYYNIRDEEAAAVERIERYKLQYLVTSLTSKAAGLVSGDWVPAATRASSVRHKTGAECEVYAA